MNLLAVRFELVRVVALAVASAALVACTAISTGSHYNETANFAAYRTFSWIDETPYISDDSAIRISPLTQRKIQQAIVDQLERVGYRYIEDRERADIGVAYTVGTRDRIRVSSYPDAYRGNWGWHIYGSHYYVREYREHSYTEGTLGIDIFDGESKMPVWHGWAEKTITRTDRDDPGPMIDKGVAKIFQSFPR